MWKYIKSFLTLQIIRSFVPRMVSQGKKNTIAKPYDIKAKY